MKKSLLIGALVIGLILAGGFSAEARHNNGDRHSNRQNNNTEVVENNNSNGSTPEGQPFQALWDAIEALRVQFLDLVSRVNDLQASSDSNSNGYQGPASNRVGAGNIAFMHKTFILTTDGSVYTVGFPNLTWNSLSAATIAWPNIDPPMSVDQIAYWALNRLVDVNGDVWVHSASNSAVANWANVGHP
ncbi:MAG: hypothetical protein Q8O87_01625 [bacterium]|nr:hypothetical protein [bacterium]